MIRRPPRSTRTDTLFPYTTLFRSGCVGANSLTVAGAVPESSWRACTRGGLHRLPVSTRWRKPPGHREAGRRSEEHTSELQSLMRISYAVFCLKKKKTKINHNTSINTTTHQKTPNNRQHQLTT